MAVMLISLCIFAPAGSAIDGVYDGGIAGIVSAALAFNRVKRDICSELKLAAAPAGVGSGTVDGWYGLTGYALPVAAVAAAAAAAAAAWLSWVV